ncbi:MAG: hypothetical protein ACO1RT_07450 [Planctomycetaceae bacterium]
MNAFVNATLAVAFLLTMVVSPIAWVCAVVFMFKTVANRKPNVPWNWNIMLDARLLTGEGLRCRAVALKAIGWFTIPILAFIALAAATGKLI